MTSQHNFTEWIIRLGVEVRYLHHQLPSLDSSTITERTAQYRRFLQHIYNQAKKSQIDLIPYYQALVEIETTLRLIEDGPPEQERPKDKIALFIDAANLSRTIERQTPKSVDIDYKKLLEYFSREAFILRAYYYTGINNENELHDNRFYHSLKQKGYHLVTKRIKTFQDGKRKGNLDIEIALDMLELASTVDRVVLFSGDGDFVPVLKRIGKMGVRTEVVSYAGGSNSSLAADLRDTADVFTDLAQIMDHIIMTKPTNNNHKARTNNDKKSDLKS